MRVGINVDLVFACGKLVGFLVRVSECDAITTRRWCDCIGRLGPQVTGPVRYNCTHPRQC